MKKFFVFIAALTTTSIISLSVYASNNSQNATAIDNLDTTSGRAICYSQYSVSETMRCLRCITCDYVAGIGITKGGYCKKTNISTTIGSTDTSTNTSTGGSL